MILFFDTETNGKAMQGAHESAPGQPRVCEVGALLTDDEGNDVNFFSMIVRPDGWTIPPELTQIHGISQEHAERVGIPTFPCHKTVDYDHEDDEGEGRTTDRSQHCAGALIFAEKNGNATQMMRIAERLRLYNAAALMADKKTVALVFDTKREMHAHVAEK